VASEAARLAETLRAAKKSQGLSASAIASEIERLTGSRPSLMWVSRRLHGTVPMIRISEPCEHCGHRAMRTDPGLVTLATVLGLDSDKMIADATTGPYRRTE
jgi:hypothetical protein